MGIHRIGRFPDEINGVKTVSPWPAPKEYDMFALLNNATKIDIDTGRDLHDTLRKLGLDRHPSLFPAARQIRLGGKMHYAFASAVLHGPGKAQLFSLDLNNVQEGGHLASGKNYYLHSNETLREDWPENSAPREVGPGCMRRLLNAAFVQSRCSHLRHLSLRKQGKQHPQQPYPGDDTTHDNEVYEEWAAFIRSVRPATLFLAHGGHTDGPYNGHPKRGVGPGLKLSDGQIAPMNEHFRRFLLPVLKQGWHSLTRLQIEGVSRQALEDLEYELDGVEVLINERVKWCWNGVIA
jgi:hypothetical protein